MEQDQEVRDLEQVKAQGEVAVARAEEEVLRHRHDEGIETVLKFVSEGSRFF